LPFEQGARVVADLFERKAAQYLDADKAGEVE
jgi:hypothetical protein